MTVKQAVSRAFLLYRRNFASLMKMTAVETALRLIAAAPLLAFSAPEIRWFALLCLPLFLLIVPPARSRAAEGYVRLARGENPVSPALLIGSGRPGFHCWQRAALLLLWALPAIIGTASAWIYYHDYSDGFMVLRSIRNLGGGHTLNGVKLLVILWLALFIPLLFGCALHSGDRHAEALTGSRSLLKKHLGGVLRAWLAGLSALLPFLAAAAVISSNYVRAVIAAVKGFSTTGSFALPPLDQNIWLLAAAFAVLCIPLVPLKSLISFCYAEGLAQEAKDAA